MTSSPLISHVGESAGNWDSASGAFISGKHQQFAQILNDYSPYFSLVWIPPKDRTDDDIKPFAILDSTPGTPAYIMRYLTTRELDDPAAILAWIFEGDMSKNRPVDVLKRMELRQFAEKLVDAKRAEEEALERQDKLEFLVSGGRDGKHWVRHNGKTFKR